MRLRNFLLLLLFIAAWKPALATTVLRVPVEELAAGVDLIVQGVVTDVSVASDAVEGRRADSTVTLRVVKVLKGHASAPVLKLRLPGMRAGGRHLSIPGMPAFRFGEEVVLFLEATGDGWIPAGLGQGKYTLRRDATTGRIRATRNMRGAAVLVRDAGGRLVDEEASNTDDDMDLDDLVRTILGGLHRTGGAR